MTHQKLLAELALSIRDLLRLATLEAHRRSVQGWTSLVSTKPLDLTGGEIPGERQ